MVLKYGNWEIIISKDHSGSRLAFGGFHPAQTDHKIVWFSLHVLSSANIIQHLYCSRVELQFLPTQMLTWSSGPLVWLKIAPLEPDWSLEIILFRLPNLRTKLFSGYHFWEPISFPVTIFEIQFLFRLPCFQIQFLFRLPCFQIPLLLEILIIFDFWKR